METVAGAAGTTGVADVTELLANLGVPFALGTFVTFALLVGEFVFEQILDKDRMVMICVLSDLLFGPVTVIAFFHRDSFSTILFFAIVWHFLCDLDIKPSTIFIMPYHYHTAFERILWFQCFWKMLHHLATAVIKFGTDMGRLDVAEEFGGRGNVAMIFFFYLTGTSLIHLSTALSHFGADRFSTAMLTLALCLKLGMGFCMWFIFWPTQSPWRYLGLIDNVWTGVYISLFVMQNFTIRPEPSKDDGTKTAGTQGTDLSKPSNKLENSMLLDSKRVRAFVRSVRNPQNSSELGRTSGGISSGLVAKDSEVLGAPALWSCPAIQENEAADCAAV